MASSSSSKVEFFKAVEQLAVEFERKKLLGQELQGIEADQARANSVLQIVSDLQGFEIHKLENSGNGGIEVKGKIGSCEVILILDESNRLTDVQFEDTTSPVSAYAAKLLGECKLMNAPNDIRYAIFYIGAVQKSAKTLKEHLSIHRQKYIVEQDPLTPQLVTFSCLNGVKASVRVNECYPQVANGVVLENVEDPDRELEMTADELRAVKDEANQECFSDIKHVVEFLLAKNVFPQ